MAKKNFVYTGPGGEDPDAHTLKQVESLVSITVGQISIESLRALTLTLEAVLTHCELDKTLEVEVKAGAKERLDAARAVLEFRETLEEIRTGIPRNRIYSGVN